MTNKLKDYNIGFRNIGNWNTGNSNIGRQNAGNWNTGVCNTSHWNTGDCNTGNRNTGSWNKCDNSTGFFNTQERTVSIFNKDSGLTIEECHSSAWYNALYSAPFRLTEWIEYTEEEKKDSIIRQYTDGYLKEYSFFEACANWWNSMDDENKALIQTIPNFDKDIFKEITGIDVDAR